MSRPPLSPLYVIAAASVEISRFRGYWKKRVMQLGENGKYIFQLKRLRFTRKILLLQIIFSLIPCLSNQREVIKQGILKQKLFKLFTEHATVHPRSTRQGITRPRSRGTDGCQALAQAWPDVGAGRSGRDHEPLRHAKDPIEHYCRLELAAAVRAPAALEAWR